MTGRQLARVSAINYRETVWSNLYAGNRHTVRCFKQAVVGAESSLELAPQRRKRIVWRMDGGAGSDENFRWMLRRDYHLLAKGISNRRAHAWAQLAKRWDQYDDYWLAEIATPLDFGRPVQVFIKRRFKDDQWLYSYYVSTLKLPSKGHFLALYDARGAAEIEQFRNDKMGLHLASRRKFSFLGQKALILLTDLAHNLLADFHQHALIGSPFENWGQKRIVRDLLHIPGHLTFDDQNLVRISLLNANPNSKSLLSCLNRYLNGD